MHTDEHLLALLEKYNGWMKEGKIPYVGKILPLQEAFRSQQWILPTQQAFQIMRNARTFALAECTCRKHYQRCDLPLETCLLINDMADAYVETGLAHRINLEQAKEILKKANFTGLVHQTAYNPEQYIWAVCSCCVCCCYGLQILLQYGRDDMVVHSDYIAVQEENRCNDCGLCVSACPEEAITLQLRAIDQRR